jgi:hypothetical protein
VASLDDISVGDVITPFPKQHEPLLAWYVDSGDTETYNMTKEEIRAYEQRVNLARNNLHKFIEVSNKEIMAMPVQEVVRLYGGSLNKKAVGEWNIY